MNKPTKMMLLLCVTLIITTMSCREGDAFLSTDGEPTVIRSFSEATVCPNDTVTVTLDVSPASLELDFKIDEYAPAGWTVIDDGGGWPGPDPNNLIFKSGSALSFTYIVQAPSQAGNYTFGGWYQFEGFEIGTTSGETSVDVIDGEECDKDVFTEEPDFPICPEGYELIGQFDGFLVADYEGAPTSITHPFSLTCDADLVVKGFAKEGHPESGCSLQGNLPSDPIGCYQNQDLESFEVAVDGDIIGYYTDNQNQGGIENAWFYAGPWETSGSADDHELTFTHSYAFQDVGAQSVDYKVSLCAKCVEEGGEGCTPGYWRQEQHFGSWKGYCPEDLFEDAFGCKIPNIKVRRDGEKKAVNDATLLEAVQAIGGGCNALARHGVAALLNAASEGIDYAMIEADIIKDVCDAIPTCDETVKNKLADYNEFSYCPVGLADYCPMDCSCNFVDSEDLEDPEDRGGPKDKDRGGPKDKDRGGPKDKDRKK